MIPRYSRPEMVAIWSPETRFRIWFEIEAHAADAQAELGVIPKAAAAAVWKAKDVEFDVARIDEIEAVTRHDVIAFLTHLAEIVGDEARFVHQGMTSSDVLDTCLAVQLARASDILLADLDALLAALKRRAFEHKDTVTIGRSHGIHAEPTTFGLKLAQAYAEFARDRARLVAARAEIATCAISGAVGTFANIDPAVEAHVAAKHGPDARADLDPGDPARPARDVLRHARGDRLLDRAAGDRDPPPAAHRGAGGGGVFRPRAEGLERDAAQAQPGADREPDRAGAAGAHGGGAGDGGRRALARARHLALVGRAGDRAGRDGDARLRAGAADRCHRPAGGLSGEHAAKHEQVPRPDPLAAGAAGADPEGRQPRGRLRASSSATR